MTIKRESLATTAVVCFLLSWLIDRLGGPVSIIIGSPIAFLASSKLLHTYPLTATSIIIRTFAIFVSAMIATELVKGKYFTKALVLFFVGMLGEFYAVQQLATGFHLTTIQWTLSIAYGSLTLVLGIVYLLLMGVWSTFNGEREEPQRTEKDSEEKSVLDPPTETN